MDKVLAFLSPFIDSSDILSTAGAIFVAVVFGIAGYVIYYLTSVDHIDQPLQNSLSIDQELPQQKKIKKSKLKSKKHGSQNVEAQGVNLENFYTCHLKCN